MGRTIQVFFNISIGTTTGGKIVFELFNDVAPNTVTNFVGLCTGQYGKSKRSGLPLSYKGCHFFKIVPGSIVQSGDFEFNNGEGGESIFGGTFHNESMLRRHCQAGVLSMVSDDKKCVGSQFMITLHRASQYDGKQVVFGQLIEGMDVLRAIEKCPITSTHCPKVPIIITDCGIEKKLPGKRRNDPKNQMREAVELLMSTVTTCPSTSKSQPLSEAQRGLRKLQQVLENSKKQEESVPFSEEIQIDDFSKEKPFTKIDLRFAKIEKKELTNIPILPSSYLTFEEPPRCESEQDKKLHLLRQKMNQEKHLIAKEVAAECAGLNEFNASSAREEEKRIIKEIKRSTKLAFPSKKNAIDCDVSSDASSSHFAPKEKRQKKKGQWSNKETAEMIQWRDKLLKKKKANAQSAFGWAIMNSDASYEAHKKKIAHLQVQAEEYSQQMLQLGETFYDPTSALVSSQFTPTEEGKNRLVKAIEKDKARKKSFSRRRKYVEAETVAYVNDFNRSFNQKLERAYGTHSVEIRQNLERGTAL